MRTIEILKLIFENTNPTVDVITAALLFFQLWITPLSELSTLYRSIKSESKQLKLLVCLVPGIFIVASGIFTPLLFGSFVSGGTKTVAMDTIVGIAASSQFLVELLVVAVVFAVLAALYCLLLRPRWREVLLTFGIETVTVVLWLVAAGGVLIEGFPLNLADTSLFPILICGYYSLIYKLLLTLVCIIAGVVFKDREQCSPADKEYFAEGGNYETAVLRFLSYRSKSASCVFFFSTCFLFGLLFYLVLNSEDLPVRLSSLTQLSGNLLFFVLLPLPLILVSAISVFLSFSSWHPLAFRKLEQQGACKLFYDEVVVKHPHMPSSGVLETERFIVQQGFLVLLVTIKPELEKTQTQRLNIKYLDALPQVENKYHIVLGDSEKVVFAEKPTAFGTEKGRVLGLESRFTLTNKRIIAQNSVRTWPVDILEEVVSFTKVDHKGRFFKSVYFLLNLNREIILDDGAQRLRGFRFYFDKEETAKLDEIISKAFA